jgi:type II secretory pathway pseudopilin PulG
MQCAHCNVALPLDARFCAACGRPLPRVQAPATSTTWVVVLVACAAGLGAIAVCGIIAAIAIPNLLNAIDRGKQKRTMADMQTWVIALEDYAEEHRQYPVVEDAQALHAQLVPEYTRALPVTDAWGHALHVASDGSRYEIVSPGKDGTFDGCGGGETARFVDDICIEDGVFSQWPSGIEPPSLRRGDRRRGVGAVGRVSLR